MAGGTLLKGTDVAITINKDGSPQIKISEFSESDFEDQYETIEDDILGETSTRCDTTWKYMQTTLKAFMATPDALDLQDSIRARAQNRSGGAVRIDIVTTLLFPGGQTRTLLLRDVVFSGFPLNISGRSERVNVTLEGKSSDVKMIK